MSEKYNDIIFNVIKSQPSITVSPFTFTYDDEVLDMDFHLSVKPVGKGEEKMPLIVLLTSKVKMEMGATIPASMVQSPMFAQMFGEDVSAEFNAMVRKGVFILKDGRYSTFISIQNGNGTVNGKPLF